MASEKNININVLDKCHISVKKTKGPIANGNAGPFFGFLSLYLFTQDTEPLKNWFNLGYKLKIVELYLTLIISIIAFKIAAIVIKIIVII